jgi:hypothetical protein
MRTLAPLSLHQFETQPFRISGSARLDADPLAVFAELADPALWFPFMRRTKWMTSATGGVGAVRQIQHAFLGNALEKMLAWEPGERVSFTFTGATSPFVDQFGEEWLLARDGIYTRVDWIVVATPSRTGRWITPLLKQTMRLLFTRGCTNIQRRAGSFRGESQGKKGA